MAYTEFYMQTTGSNLNAGSTTDDAAAVTSVNGDWANAAANRFTAASGTPFSATQVGEWASVYLDPATSAVYVAQVTAVNAGGASIDLSATAKFGTAPASGATGRSCKTGGAWASPAAINSLGTTTAPSAMRVNIKAGTYSSLAAATWAISGTSSTIPLWYRGYKTSPGDLDGAVTTSRVVGTDIPDFQFGTNLFTYGGQYTVASNMKWGGARTAGPQVLLSGSGNNGYHRLNRIRFVNTGANAASSACQNNASNHTILSECYFEASGTATYVLDLARITTVLGSAFRGGGSGLGVSNTNASTVLCLGCRFYDHGNDGVTLAASPINLLVAGCTFYSPTNDGIALDSIAALLTCAIVGNLFHNCANGINNSTGTNTTYVYRSHNSFYNSSGSNEVGFGDHPAFRGQSESADPCYNAAGGDLSLVWAALARGTGLPGLFEGESDASYPDIGCMQRREVAMVRGARRGGDL